jgi:hypothetical protein
MAINQTYPLDLVTLFLLVTLVDRKSVDPKKPVLLLETEIPEYKIDIFSDFCFYSVQYDIAWSGFASLCVRQCRIFFDLF